jgi:hypothetical protein
VADLTVHYTLSTPGGTIVFNDGTLKNNLDDVYWIQTLHGLDGAPLRTPFNRKAFGNGGRRNRWWKDVRRPIFDGAILIQSVPLGGACQELLNGMEDALRVACDSIGEGDDEGTLSWTPLGGSLRTLTVSCEVPVDFQPIEDYALRSFSFGLFAGNPDW